MFVFSITLRPFLVAVVVRPPFRLGALGSSPPAPSVTTRQQEFEDGGQRQHGTTGTADARRAARHEAVSVTSKRTRKEPQNDESQETQHLPRRRSFAPAGSARGCRLRRRGQVVVRPAEDRRRSDRDG